MTSVLVTFLASFLIFVLYAALFILWVIDGRVKKEEALHAFVSSVFALGLAKILKGVFDTARPFVQNGGGVSTLNVPTDGAFPSSHAAASFALAYAIWTHDRKLGVAFLVTALIIGVARIWANVHYPIDIAGGAILGIAVAHFLGKLHVGKLLKFGKSKG